LLWIQNAEKSAKTLATIKEVALGTGVAVGVGVLAVTGVGPLILC